MGCDDHSCRRMILEACMLMLGTSMSFSTSLGIEQRVCLVLDAVDYVAA